MKKIVRGNAQYIKVQIADTTKDVADMSEVRLRLTTSTGGGYDVPVVTADGEDNTIIGIVPPSVVCGCYGIELTAKLGALPIRLAQDDCVPVVNWNDEAEAGEEADDVVDFTLGVTPFEWPHFELDPETLGITVDGMAENFELDENGQLIYKT